MPTHYAEPFGAVQMEAQMAGLPVITTDWGAFPECVIHGQTGYRCRVLEHFVWALKHVHLLDRRFIRNYAQANYSLERVAPMFEEFFSMVLNRLR
jgi:glycosyltransferase involved in cell wall biosynthesis